MDGPHQHNESSIATRSATDKFAIVFGMLLLVFGSVGNILTMVVVAAYKTMRPSSRCLFVLLAVSDEMALVLAETRYWIIAYSKTDIRNLNGATCKIHTFFTYSFMNLSTWFLCLISLERLCLTYFPLSNHPFNQTRDFRIIIFATILTNCVKNTFYLSQEYTDGKCLAITFGSHFALEMTDLIFFTIPFLVMLIATCMTLGKILRQNNKVSSDEHPSSLNGRLRCATMMLVGIVILQLICGFPGYLITVLYLDQAIGNISKETVFLLLTLMVINNAANFYVYIILARGFRKRFFEICFSLIERLSIARF